MRHNTIATAIDKHKIASAVVYLNMIEAHIVDPYTGASVEMIRLALNNENFEWQDNTYIASSFTVDVTHEQGKLPTVTLTIQDFQNLLQPRLQMYGGGVGSNIRFIVVNASIPNAPPEMDEHFKITGARSGTNDWSVSFQIGVENPLALRFPPRTQFRDYCGWKYKGRECGYAGDMPSCDFSFHGANGCIEHDNARRYGGFPALR